ncbi:hypothetical protein VUR80DRAFT_8763 [Thermomyces stellatus]
MSGYADTGYRRLIILLPIYPPIRVLSRRSISGKMIAYNAFWSSTRSCLNGYYVFFFFLAPRFASQVSETVTSLRTSMVHINTARDRIGTCILKMLHAPVNHKFRRWHVSHAKRGLLQHHRHKQQAFMATWPCSSSRGQRRLSAPLPPRNKLSRSTEDQ